MSDTKLLVDIYRSHLKEGLYLYVKNGTSLDDLPESLKKQFAKQELAMTLALTENKKLARADAAKVMAAILDQGFYLQMPPGPEAYMQEIPNDKLSVNRLT